MFILPKYNKTSKCATWSYCLVLSAVSLLMYMFLLQFFSSHLICWRTQTHLNHILSYALIFFFFLGFGHKTLFLFYLFFYFFSYTPNVVDYAPIGSSTSFSVLFISCILAAGPRGMIRFMLVPLGRLCGTGWMFVSPLNSYFEVLTPKGDGTNRWGLWEIIRSWERSPRKWDLYSYKGDPTELLRPFHHMKIQWW